MGYTVYGVSPSDPQSHQQVQEQHDLDFDLLTDDQAEMGVETEFIDVDDEMIYRGYLAVNGETGEMAQEVDYLVGDNSDELKEVLEDL